MQFVCFSFDFEADLLKLLGLIIEANFMGYLVAVFCSCNLFVFHLILKLIHLSYWV